MSSELLDSNKKKHISFHNLPISFFLLLIGIGYIYMGITEWYEYHYPRGFIFGYQDEIVYPIHIFTGILITSTVIAVWLDKITLFKAILLGITIIIGGHALILNFLAG